MPEYELRLRFTAADSAQAERLAEAWAGTCAAEYGTRMAGCSEVFTHTPDVTPVACEWCGRAIRHVGSDWWAVKGEERGYHPPYCDQADDRRHSPSATTSYGASDE